MSDDTSGNSIVPSGTTDLIPTGRGGNRLIRRAASDALMPMNSVMNRPEPILHRVGTRQFHEEDFRQLHVWASELGLEGGITELVEILDKEFKKFASNNFGKVTLEEQFDPECQPSLMNITDWHSDGRIKFLVEFSKEKSSFPRLPKLSHLSFDLNPLTELDLSGVPALEWLFCIDKHLIKLDLSCVPDLKELYCSGNSLTELDLSYVPKLTHLFCHANRLTEIDLSYVPDLTLLGCGYNQLTELDLASVPALKSLSCENNQLTELDLASVPALIVLWCEHNQLTELDLTSVPDLTDLYCAANQLTELDIRGCQYLKSVTVDPWVVVHKRPDQTVKHLK